MIWLFSARLRLRNVIQAKSKTYISCHFYPISVWTKQAQAINAIKRCPHSFANLNWPHTKNPKENSLITTERKSHLTWLLCQMRRMMIDNKKLVAFRLEQDVGHENAFRNMVIFSAKNSLIYVVVLFSPYTNEMNTTGWFWLILAFPEN